MRRFKHEPSRGSSAAADLVKSNECAKVLVSPVAAELATPDRWEAGTLEVTGSPGRVADGNEDAEEETSDGEPTKELTMG